jgi:hypothetical protein
MSKQSSGSEALANEFRIIAKTYKMSESPRVLCKMNSFNCIASADSPNER